MTTPDVSVIVPVYNTLPYLRECLDSLVGQTIGRPRMEVIAVDDGSTDGSGELLDRYAASYPGLFSVVHQANSGGPAAPCNVGIGRAAGRYLFFLGADDRLGPEALERMVERADAWGSEVVCVKLVGTGGRAIGQELFTEDVESLPFPDLRPFIFANSKLFRADLVKRHGIRYPEEMRAASDQPFTIEAMYRSRKTSVLADYDYYYAVARTDSSNLTYDPDWRGRLEDIDTLMRHVERLIGPGEARDRILQRHFRWEIGSRLSDVRELSGDDRRALCERVARLVERHWTPGIGALLPIATRVRIGLAAAGDLDTLGELNDFTAAGARPETVLRDGRALLALPGLDPPALGQEWFEITDRRTMWWRIRAEATAVRPSREGVEVSVRVSISPPSAAQLRPTLVAVPAGTGESLPLRARVEECDPRPGSILTLTVPVEPMIEGAVARRRRRVRLELDVAGATHGLAVAWPAGMRPRRFKGSSGGQVIVRPGPGEKLNVVVDPAAGGPDGGDRR